MVESFSAIQEKSSLLPHLRGGFPEPLFKLPPEEVKALYARWKQYNLDYWQEAIKDYTFESSMVPVHYETGQALLKASIALLAMKSLTPQSSGGEFEDMFMFLEETLSKEYYQAIVSFRNALTEQLQNFNVAAGVFVRLSTLSPKDTILEDEERLKPYIIDELKQLSDKNKNNIFKLEQCVAVAIGKALNVHSADEIVYLLLGSNRVRSDLKWMLSYEEEFWDNSLVIREWNDIPLSMEFRGYCIEGKITAISQYAHDLYFDFLDEESTAENRSGQVPLRILQSISLFWDKVRDYVPYKTCIVDFVVLEDKVQIIELNPFDIYSGSLLFNWNTNAVEMLEGTNENEFGIVSRIRTKDTHQEIVYASWSEVISQCKQSLASLPEERPTKRSLLSRFFS